MKSFPIPFDKLPMRLLTRRTLAPALEAKLAPASTHPFAGVKLPHPIEQLVRAQLLFADTPLTNPDIKALLAMKDEQLRNHIAKPAFAQWLKSDRVSIKEILACGTQMLDSGHPQCARMLGNRVNELGRSVDAVMGYEHGFSLLVVLSYDKYLNRSSHMPDTSMEAIDLPGFPKIDYRPQNEIIDGFKLLEDLRHSIHEKEDLAPYKERIGDYLALCADRRTKSRSGKTDAHNFIDAFGFLLWFEMRRAECRSANGTWSSSDITRLSADVLRVEHLNDTSLPFYPYLRFWISTWQHAQNHTDCLLDEEQMAQIVRTHSYLNHEQRCQIFVGMAEGAVTAGDRDQARAHYETVLTIDPQYSAALRFCIASDVAAFNTGVLCEAKDLKKLAEGLSILSGQGRPKSAEAKCWLITRYRIAAALNQPNDVMQLGLRVVEACPGTIIAALILEQRRQKFPGLAASVRPLLSECCHRALTHPDAAAEFLDAWNPDPHARDLLLEQVRVISRGLGAEQKTDFAKFFPEALTLAAQSLYGCLVTKREGARFSPAQHAIDHMDTLLLQCSMGEHFMYHGIADNPYKALDDLGISTFKIRADRKQLGFVLALVMKTGEHHEFPWSEKLIDQWPASIPQPWRQLLFWVAADFFCAMQDGGAYTSVVEQVPFTELLESDYLDFNSLKDRARILVQRPPTNTEKGLDGLEEKLKDAPASTDPAPTSPASDTEPSETGQGLDQELEQKQKVFSLLTFRRLLEDQVVRVDTGLLGLNPLGRLLNHLKISPSQNRVQVSFEVDGHPVLVELDEQGVLHISDSNRGDLNLELLRRLNCEILHVLNAHKVKAYNNAHQPAVAGAHPERAITNFYSALEQTDAARERIWKLHDELNLFYSLSHRTMPFKVILSPAVTTADAKTDLRRAQFFTVDPSDDNLISAQPDWEIKDVEAALNRGEKICRLTTIRAHRARAKTQAPISPERIKAFVAWHLLGLRSPFALLTKDELEQVDQRITQIKAGDHSVNTGFMLRIDVAHPLGISLNTVATLSQDGTDTEILVYNTWRVDSLKRVAVADARTLRMLQVQDLDLTEPEPSDTHPADIGTVTVATPALSAEPAVALPTDQAQLNVLARDLLHQLSKAGITWQILAHRSGTHYRTMQLMSIANAQANADRGLVTFLLSQLGKRSD